MNPSEMVGNSTISYQTQWLAIVACLVFLGMVVYLIKNNRLKPGHAVVWMFFGVGLLLVSVFSDLLNTVSMVTGIYYPPAAFFVVAIGALVLVLVHFSIIISRQEKQIVNLVQELGLIQADGKRVKRGKTSNK